MGTNIPLQNKKKKKKKLYLVPSYDLKKRMMYKKDPRTQGIRKSASEQQSLYPVQYFALLGICIIIQG